MPLHGVNEVDKKICEINPYVQITKLLKERIEHVMSVRLKLDMLLKATDAFVDMLQKKHDEEIRIEEFEQWIEQLKQEKLRKRKNA